MLCSAITSTSPPPKQCKEQPLEAPREIWGTTLVVWTKKQVIYPERPVLHILFFATHDMLLDSCLLSPRRGCILAVSRQLPNHSGLVVTRRRTCNLKVAKIKFPALLVLERAPKGLLLSTAAGVRWQAAISFLSKCCF